ncbi:MAG: hypothetical protein RL662_1247 [Bacteroidota bacterium]
MQLINLEHSNQNIPLVATIGFFDGVHTGHQYLIEQLRGLAATKGLPSAVITFPMHPRRVLNKEYVPALLCAYNEKLRRLSATSVDYSVVLDFTTEMSNMSAKKFMENILKHKVNVKTLLIGYDHRFGHNREDGFEEYRKYGQEVGIEVLLANELSAGMPVSSSCIRHVLAKGDIKQANKLLGYNYTISGKIIEGFKVGRTIGFPTANMEIWEDFKVIPAFGVYAVYVHTEKQKYKGMLYIGRRPTLQNGKNISLEVNLFDFDEDLYGKTLTTELIEFIRPDQKYGSLEALKNQIFKDKENVIETLDMYAKTKS